MGILFIARHLLDADSFASFAFYLSLATLCYGISKFSFDAYAIREFVLNPSQAIPVLWRIMLIRSIGSIVIIGSLVAGLSAFHKYEELYSLIIVFQVVRVVDTVEWLLRAEGKLATQAVVRIVSMVVVLSALTVLLVNKPSVSAWHIVLVQVSEWVVILVAYLTVLARKAAKELPGGEIDKVLVAASVKKVVTGSMYAYVGFVLFLLYSKVDQFLLNWLLQSESYGVYMIAARLTETAVVLIMSLNLYFYPKLVSAHAISFERFSMMVRRISLAFLLMATVVVLCVWMARGLYDYFPPVLRDVVPNELLLILSWMIFSVVPVFFFGLRSSFFTIIDEPKNILAGAVCGVIVAVFVGVPLMRFFGVYGGIACVVLVAISSLLLSNFISMSGRRYLKIVFGLESRRGA